MTEQTEYRRMAWGRSVPIESPVAWGARTIQEGDSFSILPDRMDWHVADDSPLTGREAGALVDRHVLPVLRKLYYDGTSEEVHSGKVETPEGHTFEYEASTHASYGYVYIAVWLAV